MEWAFLIVGAGVVAVAAAEATARALRISDYPLFRPDERFGYGFAPGAAGIMSRRYRWRINRDGLRLDHDDPPGANGILLVGDSTVEDGAHTDQAETLAARLERAAGQPVYPVACPSWSLENELAFLRAHPRLLEAGTIVLVSNSHDLEALDPWRSDLTHPTRRPLSHLWYKLRRVALPLRHRLMGPAAAPERQPNGGTWTRSVETFLAKYDGRVIWLYYPLLEETRTGAPACARLRPLVEGRAETLDLASVPGWSEAAYKDHIHPNGQGRQLMLEALQTALERSC